MLVLARRSQESIVISVGNHRITLTVIDIISDRKVRLGFDAPEEVVIHRKEIQDVIDSENPNR